MPVAFCDGSCSHILGERNFGAQYISWGKFPDDLAFLEFIQIIPFFHGLCLMNQWMAARLKQPFSVRHPLKRGWFMHLD
jgi:hypothetical protein